jgi:hypothetical protein
MTQYNNRTEMYMAVNKLWPDEIAGATELEMEQDLRGITGDGHYAMPGYCSQLSVSRCSNCSLTNYGRDCHNNPIAQKRNKTDNF